MAAVKLFNFPKWITPAICFNNTTSLPLLLIQSLDATGILSRLVISESDTTKEAIDRAKSYFLVCAILSNSLTFALGPRLMYDEDGPEGKEKEDKEQDEEEEHGDVDQRHDEEDGQHADGLDDQNPDETTSLLPSVFIRRERTAENRIYYQSKRIWDKIPPRVQTVLDIVYAFFNAPVLGAIAGAIIGLSPPLHKAFFGESTDGGFLNAWLTSSIKNIGDLFATLQIVVVGVKLSSSLRKLKRGEDSGKIPWIPGLCALTVRFVVWPL